MTPRPAALRCYLSLHLPHSMRLHQLTVHGSFLKILSVLAAPEVVTDARALARCAALHRHLRRQLSSLAPSRIRFWFPHGPALCLLLPMCRQCARVRVEAQQVVWQLPASCRGHPDAEAALAGMLLQPDAAWER